MVRTASRESQRHTIYLLTGVVLGIAVMAAPSLLLLALPQTLWQRSVPLQFLAGWGVYGVSAAASPLDVLVEVLWLVLPALIVILALYWLAVHRTHWAGYDEAAKWSRR
jgi:hypothetical protein